MYTFCTPMVKEYPTTARNMSDSDIQFHLNSYAEMDDFQWKDPMYRHWRRLVIIEGLKRGLIANDPGPHPF